MPRTVFRLLLLVILISGAWIARNQRAAIRSTRAALQSNATLTPEFSVPSPASTLAPPPAPPSPSLELLRRRAEVTRLRQELDTRSPRAQAITRAAEEWTHVWEGIRPSQQPGFVFFTNLAPAGFSTPEAAFASFQYVMRNQTLEPLTPTNMKEIFDVPDDFDDPNARYSIHLGEGISGEIGYRVFNQEFIDPTQVRLIIEMENPDGSHGRQARILVLRDGRWRMKPQGIQRQP